MTIDLFSSDSYIKEFESKVSKVDQEEKTVVLSETAFYPGGGGQPCDLGKLIFNDQECQVVKVKRAGTDILHYLDGPLPAESDIVKGVLDWNRRFNLMRTHSALHVMCGVIWRDYQAQVTGGNMEPCKGRLDFQLESFSAELVTEIEAKINAEVSENRPINAAILPREEAFKIPDLIRTKVNLLPESLTEIRVVTIENLDMQADGGTHVANTGEIGQIRIVKHKSKGKNNKRIEIALEDCA